MKKTMYFYIASSGEKYYLIKKFRYSEVEREYRKLKKIMKGNTKDDGNTEDRLY